MIESQRPDVALLDITLPELHGFELFRKIRAVDDKIPIIFVTADCSSDTTIQAMRIGAYDYLSKPINVEQLSRMVTSAGEARRIMDEPVSIPLSNDSVSTERFIGRSIAMQNVYKAIGRVAAQDVAVLVRGESGCGKELVARAILQHSERSTNPFTIINCAAIPDQLLESELFGHEKGAFTGAEHRRKGNSNNVTEALSFLMRSGTCH